MTAAKQEISKSNGKPQGEIVKAKTEIIESTERRITELVDGGMLHLPPNYSAPNALRAAWLILQETVDRNKKPVLSTCTRASIANSLLSMVVQGLDPNRNQAYFIAHGTQLTLRRSYFGTLALAKRLGGVKDAYAEVIYDGDEFEFETERGKKKILRHKQTLDGIAKGTIVGAYCVVEFVDGREDAEVMPMAEIQKAWSKGGDNNPARRDFPGEMAKRTVLNRALKRHINSSDDEHLGLVLAHVNRNDVQAAHDEVDEEAAEHGNQQYIDVDVEEPDEQLALEDDQAEADTEPEEATEAAEPDGDGRLFEKPAPRSAVQPPF